MSNQWLIHEINFLLKQDGNDAKGQVASDFRIALPVKVNWQIQKPIAKYIIDKNVERFYSHSQQLAELARLVKGKVPIPKF